jgi:hypothetical protein
VSLLSELKGDLIAVMNRILIVVVFVVSLSMVADGATRRSTSRKTTVVNKNLCPNGGLDAEGNPLEGWMIDYAWTGNGFYVGNKNFISALPSYKGRKGILHLRAGNEVKVESPAIPFDLGSKYKCVMTYQSNGSPHIYFTGYKWKPGVRPYYDKPIHLGDLRRIYKSQFRNHQYKTLGGGWKQCIFDFPMDKPSKRAMQNLKYIRYFTLYVISVTGSGVSVWIDDVQITEKKNALKFLTAAEQAKIDKKNEERKIRLKERAKQKYLEEKKYLESL